MKKKSRILYLDELRTLAVLAVIFIHTAAQHWADKDIPFKTWFVFNFWDGILQWTVPVFIMISGAVFLDRDYKINVRKLYTHNILRIITAYLSWSFLYAVYQVHIEGGGISRVLALTLDGHYHLWFLYMITALYILTPPLKKIPDDDLKYLLIISLILSFIIPTLINLKNVYISFSNNEIINKSLDQIFSPYLLFIKYVKIDYLGYYILGHFLHEIQLKKQHLKIIYASSIVSFIFTVSFSAIVTFLRKEPYGIYDIFTVNMLLESAGIFLFIKQRYYEKGIKSEKTVKMITVLSGCNFGIYLVHAMILEVFNNELGINSLSFSPLLSVPLVSVSVFLISLGITLIIKKVPVLNKYMV